jgi:hypothetical protein
VSGLFSEESGCIVSLKMSRDIASCCADYVWRVQGLMSLPDGTPSVMLACDRSGVIGCVLNPRPAEKRRALRKPGWRWFDDTRVRLVMVAAEEDGWWIPWRIRSNEEREV